MGAFIANRLSYPSWARRRVSGFSANLNLKVRSSRVSRGYPPDPKEAYQRKYIWRLEGNVIERLIPFLSFCITRDDVFRHTLKFLECEAHTTLVKRLHKQRQEIHKSEVLHSLH